MRPEDSGQPILARQNPVLYWVIIGLIAAVILILLISFIARKISAWRHSSKFAQKRKENFTTKKNVTAIGRKASLSDEEMKLLWHICKKNKAPNIVFLNNDAEAVESLFKKQYIEMSGNGSSQEQIAVLFSMMRKLEKIRENNSVITSSAELKEGQELIFKDSEGFNWTLLLSKQNPQGATVEIPKMFFINERKPAPLSKFFLTVPSTGMNSAYLMQARVIRYEEALEGKFLLIMKPAKSLEPIQRRKYRRVDVNVPCIFSEVEPRAKSTGNTKGYAVLGESINGTIDDISAAGCSLSGSKDILSGHYLLLKFQIDGNDMEAVGIILSTTKDFESDRTNYHIKFIDIQTAVKNQIYAHVYGYSNGKEEK